MHTPDPKEKLRVVTLVPPDPNWIVMFEEAAQDIRRILDENVSEIYHIGSTAIPDIYAKPIVDVLIVVNDITLVDAYNSEFEALGYTCMGEYGIKGRRFYWKSKGERTHQLHLFETGAPEIEKHLDFRNFMREHKNYAEAYSVLKRTLSGFFPTDIERYLNGKAPFIRAILEYIDRKEVSKSPVEITLTLPDTSAQKQWVALLAQLGYAPSDAEREDVWHFPGNRDSQNSLYSLHMLKQNQ